MSFILDALKKSDAERQQRSTPGFADIPVSRPERAPSRWIWIVGGLLAVNLVAVIALLVRPGSAPESQVVETTVEPQAAKPEAAKPEAMEPEAVPASRQASRPFADIVAEARESQPEGDRPATTRRQTSPGPAASVPARSTPQPEPAPAEASGAASAPEDAVATEQANTFESLRADGTLKLPDLHLDVHVYSETPGERFVFINTKKYRENETLTEGPSVRQIAPEGVILEHRGTVFLLPRD